MTAADDERRPRHRSAASSMGHRRASHRFQYVAGRAHRQVGPSSFGLTDGELWAHAAALVCDQGWSLDEVRQVLLLPEMIA